MRFVYFSIFSSIKPWTLASHGKTPLICAIEHKNLDLFKFLLHKGADIHSKSKMWYIFNIIVTKSQSLATSNKQTALHSAAKEGILDIVKCLLDKGADVHVKSKICAFLTFSYLWQLNIASNGETPLHIAARHGNLDVVRLLLNQGSDIHIKCKILGYITS